SDTRAYDGTVTIIQPLIAPLYGSKSAHELLAALANRPQQSSYEAVREYWMTWRGAKGLATIQSAVTGAQPQTQPQAQPQTQSQSPTPAFEQWWQEALQTGVAPDTAFKPKQVSAKTDWSRQNATTSRSGTSNPTNPSGGQNALEIIFRPDPSIYDGRFAHNGWLQELPKPLTKITSGNAIEVSPATAERYGRSYELAWRGGEHGQALADVVELQYKGRKLLAPVWIVPGHADGCATVHLGHGRARGGSVGSGLGF